MVSEIFSTSARGGELGLSSWVPQDKPYTCLEELEVPGMVLGELRGVT